MNVRKLNGEKAENLGGYKSLLLLDEISKGQDLSQRDLSKKLNLALGLVNSYIKNLISKGYVTIKNIPSKRYAYYLTPKGFAEKSRLTYHLLHDYNRIFREARRNFKQLFTKLHKDGVASVVFAGADEVAEIAYLSLQEVDIELKGVVDNARQGKDFFRTEVRPVNEITSLKYDSIIITTYLMRDLVYKELLSNGVPGVKIQTIYEVSGVE
ncbi:hypothetical protein BMS3Bbin08_02336 [bacterium BMS3Bbin08]|nr:hypothetical protein BMS3Bbin08_02336 [bacterium BMS3Bbin08]